MGIVAMAVARQNELQQRLGRLEKEFEAFQKNRLTAGTATESKATTAGIFPLILTIIAVVGGSYCLLSERSTETSMQLNKRIDDVNNRFDDVNRRFDDVNMRFDDMNRRFDDINAKLDRLLLK